MNSNVQVSLDTVAQLVSTKVPVSMLQQKPYISTENMFQNLRGMIAAEQPATGRVNEFRPSDTLFSNIRPYFRKVYYARNHGGCSADVLVFRSKNPSTFEPAYLYYCLANPAFIDYAMATSKGAKMPRGDKEAMKRYKVSMPSIEEQKRVVKLLRGIDDLIEGLRAQNTALESIVRTIFCSWFLKFEPVHIKSEGKVPEVFSEEILALFPEEFEGSKLGLIPKGWRAGRLSELCKINPESWTTSSHPEKIKYIDLSGLKKNVLISAEDYAYQDAPSRARRVLRRGDTLFGTVRPGNLSYGYIGSDEPGLTGSTGFALLRPTESWVAEFVYCSASHKDNIERLVRLADGAAYPAVNPEVVHQQEVVIPSEATLKAFHNKAEPLFTCLENNNSLMLSLVSLRDLLIPRLVSGKMLAEEVAALVEEAIPA